MQTLAVLSVWGVARALMIDRAKSVLRTLLRHFGFEVYRVPKALVDPRLAYSQGGHKAWGPGYAEVKQDFICSVLDDPMKLDLFRTGSPLPDGYGIGLDERCVEYPWFMANLPRGVKRLLDAGSALNHRYLLDRLQSDVEDLHILTLAPEKECFWQRGISYLYADLRDMPLRDGIYDAVACISTLEHVGLDNKMWTACDAFRECRTDDFELAVKELVRLLKPSGTLMLTVPFGAYVNQGFQQQYDAALLGRIIRNFPATCRHTQTFYRYTFSGWNIASQTGCEGSEYVRWIADAWSSGNWPDPLPTEPDRAAAARAVACVKMEKGN